MSSITNTVLDRPSALNSSTYTPHPCNTIPTNEIDDILGTTMFSSSHRILPGSPGEFWYLQVGFNYLEGQDSKTTMLFGLSALMEILPNAIDGFTLHPLDTASTFPPLTNTKPDDGFPSSAALAFKYFLVEQEQQQGCTAAIAIPTRAQSPPSPL